MSGRHAVASALVLALLGTACSKSIATPPPSPLPSAPVIGTTEEPGTDVLPEPYPVPDVPDPETSLAMLVRDGGRDGTAALVTALRLSGIAVIDADGVVVHEPAAPAQGLGLMEEEVAALAELEAAGGRLPLDDITQIVSDIVLAEYDVDHRAMSAGVVADVERLSDGDGDAPITFFARFLDALGDDQPRAERLGTGTPRRVTLGGAQSGLLLLRLAGDIATLGRGGTAPAKRAARAPVAMQTLIPPDEPRGPDLPCSFAASTQAGADAEALMMSTAMQEAAEKLQGAAAATAASLANAALAVLRLLVMESLFEADYRVIPAAPLRRTITTQEGERIEVSLSISFDTGQGTLVNCFRHLANLSGIDFSLPADGPVEGAEITWDRIEGFASSRRAGMVRLYDLNQSVWSTGKGPHRTRTDATGETRTGIEGAPQRRDHQVGGADIPRQAVLIAKVNLKPADLYTDLLDALGVLTAGIGAPIALISGLLERLGAFNKTIRVPVIDHAFDYRVDETKGDIRVFGVRCDGPEGDWELTLEGAIAGESGVSFTVGGSVTFSVDSSLGGEYDADIGIDASGIPSAVLASLGIDAHGTGDVEVVTNRDGTARIRFLTGPVSGSVTADGPNVSANLPLTSEGDGAGTSIAATIGTFPECDQQQ